MKGLALYICGLSENINDPLPKYILNQLDVLGYDCQAIELYPDTTFGAYSFLKEIKRIKQIVLKSKPSLICAHSLGAYIALQINISCPILLLDPSLAVNGIALPEQDNCSSKFLSSLSKTLPIESVAKLSRATRVQIVGAGHGGYKVAKEYKTHMPHANYTFLPNADHDFSNKRDLDMVVEIIKKALG
jgi:predicted esterase YcpF (UPF0227 family)